MNTLIYYIRLVIFKMQTLPPFNSILTHLYFRLQGIQIGKNVKIYRIPMFKKHPKSTIKIGSNVLINSSIPYYSGLLMGKCKFQTWSKSSVIEIDDDCGLSGITIISMSRSIKIGRGTIIAGNCVIMDSDMHHISPVNNRWNSPGEGENIINKDIIIEENVWIGLNCIVLKGVTIGKGSVIAAGSVVVGDIPPMVVAGGVPAKVLKRIED